MGFTTSLFLSRTGLLRLIRFSSCFSLHLHALLEARSRMALNAERFSTTVRVHIWFQTCLVGLVPAAPVRYREFLVSQTYSNLSFLSRGVSDFREPSRIDFGQTASRMPKNCPPACCQRFCCLFGVHPPQTAVLYLFRNYAAISVQGLPLPVLRRNDHDAFDISPRVKT